MLSIEREIAPIRAMAKKIIITVVGRRTANSGRFIEQLPEHYLASWTAMPVLRFTWPLTTTFSPGATPSTTST